MADVLLLAFAALAVLGGGTVTALIVRAGRRRRAAAGRDRPAALRRELDDIGTWISDVNKATAEPQLDRLERQHHTGEKKRAWGGLFSPS
jgi:hypothetical protein